jgi:formate dehydrogenase subunit gamma
MDQRLTDPAASTPLNAPASTDAPPTNAPPRGEFIARFSLATRLAHWGLAVPFVLLLLTGITNYWPRLKAAQVADVRVFAWLHVVLGFGMVGIILWVLLALLPRRAVRGDVRELARADLDDYLWLQHQGLRAVGERSVAPPVRKFNAGQKLNALASAVFTAGLVFTGVVLGVNYTSKEVFSVDFVEPLFAWHTRLALLFVPVLLGHVYLALLHPSTRESLRGMTAGVVRRDWARQHHPAWAASADTHSEEPP